MKVFISHSSDDKRFVRTLKDDLNENGIHTWVDEDELAFGDSLAEKLEESIEDTSHFIIVLSESSINSAWVQKELSRVLTKLDRKIIPIKYKRCEVPEEIEHLIHADVSGITRITDRDRLIFRDDKYYHFIDKLVKSLDSPDTLLSRNDKKLLTLEEESPASFLEEQDKKYLSVRIMGYVNNTARERYISKLEEQLQGRQALRLKSFINKPIILPDSFKKLFKDIKMGDKIIVKNKENEQKAGLFAGFREGDDVLILPVSIRNYLNIPKTGEAFDIVVSAADLEIMVL